MAVKDYYIVLGVPRDASEGGIRAAFRDLARQHHPDLAGPEGASAFRDVVEAYRVLSDPASRRRHDAHLEQRVPVGSREPRAGPARGPRSFRSRPLSTFERPEAVRPSADALLARLIRNFPGPGIPRSEGPGPLFCDVSLSHEEARRGGVLPLELPATSPCPDCRGAGHAALFVCRRCRGDGRLRQRLEVPLRIPPGIRPGTEIEVSLTPWGIADLRLRVRIGVEAGA